MKPHNLLMRVYGGAEAFHGAHTRGSGGKQQNLPDTKMRLSFIKSGYMVEGYIPTITEVELKTTSSKSESNIRKDFTKLFAMDISGSSGK